MSQTKAKTFTFARMQLLTMQVRIALRRATGIAPHELASVEKGVQNKWITRVSIFGLDARNLCKAELSLEIDWLRHEVHISQGRGMVATDAWGGDTAIELQEALTVFTDFVAESKLSSSWVVTYSSNVDVNMVDRELGFSRVNFPKWASSPDAQSRLRPKEIDEFGIHLRFISG